MMGESKETRVVQLGVLWDVFRSRGMVSARLANLLADEYFNRRGYLFCFSSHSHPHSTALVALSKFIHL